jgi:phage shock protein A
MAQDFHAAFGTGTDDKHIATVDADGVALAAIQGLNEKLEEKESVITELRNETSALRENNEAMEARLAALEELLSRQQANRTKANANQAAR